MLSQKLLNIVLIFFNNSKIKTNVYRIFHIVNQLLFLLSSFTFFLLKNLNYQRKNGYRVYLKHDQLKFLKYGFREI